MPTMTISVDQSTMDLLQVIARRNDSNIYHLASEYVANAAMSTATQDDAYATYAANINR